MKSLTPRQVLNNNLQRDRTNHQAHLLTHILKLRKSLCLWRRKLHKKLQSMLMKNKSLQNRSKKYNHLWISMKSKYRVILKAWSKVLISISKWENKCKVRDLRAKLKTVIVLMIPNNRNMIIKSVIELTSLKWTWKPWAPALLLHIDLVFISTKKVLATSNLNTRLPSRDLTNRTCNSIIRMKKFSTRIKMMKKRILCPETIHH